MKKIFLVLTAAALALTLCACGGNDSSKTSDASKASTASVASQASTESDSSKSGSDLKSILEKVKAEVKMPAETSDFNAAKMKRTFGIEEDWMDDFAGLYCTDGLTQDEIVYVKAKNADTAKQVEAQLQKNWESKYNVIKNYSPENRRMLAELIVCDDIAVASMVYSEDGETLKMPVQ